MGITTVDGSTASPLDSDENSGAGAAAPVPRVAPLDDNSADAPATLLMDREALVRTVLDPDLPDDTKQKLLKEYGIDAEVIEHMSKILGDEKFPASAKSATAYHHLPQTLPEQAILEKTLGDHTDLVRRIVAASPKIKHAASIGARELQRAKRNGINFIRHLAGKPLVGYNDRKRLEHVAQVAGDRAEHVGQVAGQRAEHVGQVAGQRAEHVGQVAGQRAEHVAKKAKETGRRVGKSLKKRF